MAGPEQSRSTPQRNLKFVEKPLLGFGPAGWVLTPIAIAIAACWYLGIDLRNKLFWLITDTLGVDALYWVVSRWLPWAWFQLSEPVFSPICVAYILVLCHLSPRRVAWWKYGLLGAWCVLVPALAVPAYRVLPGMSTSGWAAALLGAADLIGTGAMLWLVVGRWRILSVALIGMVLGRASWVVLTEAAATNGLMLTVTRELYWGSLLLYHASIAGSLLWWVSDSRRARRRSATACPACGYELAGLPAGGDGIQCPECGLNVPLFTPPREPVR